MDVSTKTNEDHFLRRDKGASPEIQRLCQSKCKRYACDIQKCLERNSYQEKSLLRQRADRMMRHPLQTISLIRGR
ncbi:hypothetical protein NGA_0450600 [Nannochloropsis gaditana CCMP526]|uniref:uncharacterized protein n=1 Tax=Nannochloropsis gaditana (strain CCMP526) TaxID=1093141 RepID=UPI00029F5319|nr:hypothetical protein NGA_0450600 [Nannochloropsis gaditana CCMP526]EKU22341.1 hypothetical protein NGA_0450600 [Nannochloropsis gaditana CCMP526]|eukprot:XP_005854018.1 hypothetical protein NGA_0450600 [Nannochloropsis gaditana CCMP526]